MPAAQWQRTHSARTNYTLSSNNAIWVKVRWGEMSETLQKGQTSASLGFIERVKFELFEMYNLKPSQAWVFPTTEILFKSSSSFLKSKTQFRVVTICFKVIKLESSFKLFVFFCIICILLNCSVFVMAEFNWSKLKLWPSISYRLEKRIYFTFQKEKEKAQKKLKKRVFFKLV